MAFSFSPRSKCCPIFLSKRKFLAWANRFSTISADIVSYRTTDSTLMASWCFARLSNVKGAADCFVCVAEEVTCEGGTDSLSEMSAMDEVGSERLARRSSMAELPALLSSLRGGVVSLARVCQLVLPSVSTGE